MVDFPNSPADGDTHTENGSTWFWQANPGIWALGEGNSVEIARAAFDSNGGWQVWGDVLIQWGTAQTDGSGVGTATYPVAYKTGVSPRVSGLVMRQPAGGQPPYVVMGSGGVAGTGSWSFNVRTGSGAAVADTDVDWVAIGEAPDDLKMAKEVGAGGGGGGGASITIGDTFPVSPPPVGSLHYLTAQPVGLYVLYEDADSQQWVQTNGAGAVPGGVEAFHDPSQLASWRLDRDTNTLECWGYASGNGATVVFPKTFARNPSIQLTSDTGSTALAANDTRVENSVNVSATGMTIQKRRIQGTASPEVIGGTTFWRAIGEWDGVS